MRPLNSPTAKIILALLPLTTPAFSFDELLIASEFTALAVFGAASFFSLTAPLFPKKLLSFALILLVGTIFQVTHYFTQVSPLWIASFFFLFDWNDVDANRLGQKPSPLLIRLGLFMGSILLIGLVKQILANQMGLSIFTQPAGAAALLAVLALLLSLKRRRQAA